MLLITVSSYRVSEFLASSRTFSSSGELVFIEIVYNLKLPVSSGDHVYEAHLAKRPAKCSGYGSNGAVWTSIENERVS
ncbi:hypothetical protein CVS30_16900 [Arthrobacter psychrolactophilus]|uniref:Uncharacterized protein n=1 Tax=Arthrobacter psychrolactophilus TaxID=92442 RepID=A0A2V5JJ56_9MICC|nr:hypothetical protein CVS30_16900 [Arthrobacter psychrolactophilus]